MVDLQPHADDNRGPQATKNYGHNFAMPMHPNFFALMSPVVLDGGASGNHNKRQQSQLQQQSLKGGGELIQPQAFVMPFASFTGGTISGLDLSMTQNHVIFQSIPDAARHGYEIAQAAAAAAQSAQQKKIHQILEEGKTVIDSINVDDERKTVT